MLGLRLWIPAIAVNLILSLLLLGASLSYPLPPGNLTLADAETGTVAEEICLQEFADHDRTPISPVLRCSTHLMKPGALTARSTIQDPPTKISAIFRREIGAPTSPDAASTLATTAPPSQAGPARLTGPAWFAAGLLAILLILLTGLLAGLTLGVMSVDMTRLRVWTRTGSEERR